MKPWHEDDGFWADTQVALFGADRWLAAPLEVEQALRLAGDAAGPMVLDLGCGPGRHALELARRGLRVTGVDRTVAHLDEARRRAAAEGLAVEWVEADMRTFVRPAAFDLALSLFTSFGYFEDPADDLRVARHLRRSLRPGGIALFELMGKEVLARIFRERDWHPIDERTWIIEERRVERGWTWMHARWIVVRDGRICERVVEHRIYSAAELIALLHSAGFVDGEAFGGLGGEPYDHRAERLVVRVRAGSDAV